MDRHTCRHTFDMIQSTDMLVAIAPIRKRSDVSTVYDVGVFYRLHVLAVHLSSRYRPIKDSINSGTFNRGCFVVKHHFPFSE